MCLMATLHLYLPLTKSISNLWLSVRQRFRPLEHNGGSNVKETAKITRHQRHPAKVRGLPKRTCDGGSGSCWTKRRKEQKLIFSSLPCPRGADICRVAKCPNFQDLCSLAFYRNRDNIKFPSQW
jgi:hypothetical protein